MPNQNPTQDPQNIPVQTDLPPLPPDFQSIPADQPTGDTGSAAPPDSNLPPMVTAPKKKFGGGKIIATILGIFLLVGGVGTGVYLVRQQQTADSKATVWTLGGEKYYDKEAYESAARRASTEGTDAQEVAYYASQDAAAAAASQGSNNNECGGPGQKVCEVVCEGGSCHYGNVGFDINSPPAGITCNRLNCWANTSPPVPSGNCVANEGDCLVTTHIGVVSEGPNKGQICDGPHKTTCAAGYTCRNYDCVPPELIQTSGSDTPPPSTSSTASCQNVKAYSSVWTPLTSADLSALSTGTVVNFCVTGTTTSGTFDKAKFTINGTVQAETTAIRPSSTDFCQSYTIPVGVSVFNVSAQIHHATLGWF
jgi:hypothetical protein